MSLSEMGLSPVRTAALCSFAIPTPALPSRGRALTERQTARRTEIVLLVFVRNN
jgi:hypothetical protein